MYGKKICQGSFRWNLLNWNDLFDVLAKDSRENNKTDKSNWVRYPFLIAFSQLIGKSWHIGKEHLVSKWKYFHSSFNPLWIKGLLKTFLDRIDSSWAIRGFWSIRSFPMQKPLWGLRSFTNASWKNEEGLDSLQFIDLSIFSSLWESFSKSRVVPLWNICFVS